MYKLLEGFHHYQLRNDKNLTQTSRKPHAETTKDPRFNVSP
jgi:hypothetical protein